MAGKRVLGSRFEVPPKRPKPHYAEARCVLCGREVTVRGPTTAGAVDALRYQCLRGGWRTILLPEGGRSILRRRAMVCRRCYGALRPVSRSKPARKAIQFDAW